MEAIKMAGSGDVSEKMEMAIDEIATHVARFAETAAAATIAGRETTMAAQSYSELVHGLDDQQFTDMWTVASNASIVAAGMVAAYAVSNFKQTDEEIAAGVEVLKEQFGLNMMAFLSSIRAGQEAAAAAEATRATKQ